MEAQAAPLTMYGSVMRIDNLQYANWSARIFEQMREGGLVRFMQLSYNNQSLLATGCYESEDPGLTRMGREVIEEMNRVGMIVDMSHSSDRSTIEAAEVSTRPIAITHANPAQWHPARRNKSDTVLKAVTGGGGMLGFSLYPHHLKQGGRLSRHAVVVPGQSRFRHATRGACGSRLQRYGGRWHHGRQLASLLYRGLFSCGRCIEHEHQQP